MLEGELAEWGQALLLARDFAAAACRFRSLTEKFPANARYWFLYGAAQHSDQQLSEAQAAFLRAIQLEPAHLQSLFALVAVCLSLQEPLEALKYSRRTIDLAPNDPRAHTNLAIVLETLGDLSEALESYDHALKLDHAFADALKNRGALLVAQARWPEAIANNRCFVALHPQRYDAHFNLGHACLQAHAFADSAEAFKLSLQYAPDHVPSLRHRGYALAILEQYAEAQELLDRAERLEAETAKTHAPEKPEARTLFLLYHYEQIEECKWNSRTNFIERFIALTEDHGHPLTDRALGFRAMTMSLPAAVQLALARQIADAIRETIPVSLAKLRPDPMSHRNSARRLRVGYISPDFRNHAVATLAHLLFKIHDRRQFETFGYGLGEDDGSAERKDIISGFEHFSDLNPLDNASAAKRIAGDKIDILVDMAGHTSGSRPEILAYRPAPLQIAWLGYLATLGAPWIDYFVADRIIVSPEQEFGFSEAILRLNNGLYLCSYANNKLAAPPSREEAGLPESGFVLAAINAAQKIDPEIFALWMRLLRALPDAVLWLVDFGQPVRENLRKAAQTQGIAPERLLFAPRLPHAMHLARLQLADLALDTPQYNGHTTTIDALVAGVPVLTCIGKLPVQRVAASLLHLTGLDELIVDNLADYESLALDLLQNPEKLRQLKQKLKNARATAPFFKPQDWVREFEAGLQQIWQRHCAGLPPASMDVHYEPTVSSPTRKRVTAIY